MRKIKCLTKLTAIIMALVLSIGWLSIFSVQKNKVSANSYVSSSVSGVNSKYPWLGGKNDDDYLGSTLALTTNKYTLEDNSGYKSTSKFAPAVTNGNFTTVTLDINNGGEIVNDGNKSGIDHYGYIAGEPVKIYDGKCHNNECEHNCDRNNCPADESNPCYLEGCNIAGYEPSVSIKLNFNDLSARSSIAGTTTEIKNVSISNDSYKNSVNGVTQTGPVQSGVLMVQKSETGLSESWQFPNTYDKNLSVKGYHTNNFTNLYNTVNYGKNPFTIYVPDGKDLAKGIYIKVSFAYEICYQVWEFSWDHFWNGSIGDVLKHGGYAYVTHYVNVLEETIFYISNASGEVVFKNLYYSPSVSENVEKEETLFDELNAITETEQKSGSISNLQGSIDGFRIDTKENQSYKITYKKNGFDCGEAFDGDVFFEPGKYDFHIETKAGTFRDKTVYIHDNNINKATNYYFGDSFITNSSQRLFDIQSNYPSYVAGQTYFGFNQNRINDGIIRAPLVGRIYRITEYDDGGRPTEADEVATFDESWTFKKINNKDVIILNNIVMEGDYVAIFANNAEYFSGTATGDTYKFVYRFNVFDNKTMPTVNEQLLRNNYSISSFVSKYYAVVVPSLGTGNIVFAHFSYSTAYSTAYEYQRSLVQFINPSEQADILAEIDQKAKEMIEFRYFDMSNPESVATLNNAITYPKAPVELTEEQKEDTDIVANYEREYQKYLTELSEYNSITNRSYLKDVIVFNENVNLNYGLISEISLNDKTTYVMNENGETTIKTEPVTFVKISDYESNRISLYHLDSEGNRTGVKFENVNYGVPMQSFLESRNAPSGSYMIVEKNIFATSDSVEDGNVNIYYATYIARGDNQTSINISRLYNGNTTTQNYTKAMDGKHYTANAFTINSASNLLDSYGGIIKITKQGYETKIYSLNEVNDLRFYEGGNYEITTVDRFGNVSTVYFNIFSESGSYVISFKNNEEITTQNIYGGQTIKLPTPANNDEALEFIGWEYNGKIYNDTFKFTAVENITLNAVWNYKETIINVFDGDIIKEYVAKPGETVELPQVSKLGYKFSGFMYLQPNGTYMFYNGQITSVPNVKTININATWQKIGDSIAPEVGQDSEVKITLVDGNDVDTLTASFGESISLPQPTTPSGMKFIGWQYKTTTLSGQIFKTNISNLPESNSMVLIALWESDDTNSDHGMLVVGSTSFSNNLKSFVSAAFSTTISIFPYVLGLAVLLFIIMCLIKQLKSLRRIIEEKPVEVASNFDTSKSQICNLKSIETVKIKTPKTRLYRKRCWHKHLIMPAILCLMAFIFAFNANANLFHQLKLNYEVNETRAALTEQFESLLKNNDEEAIANLFLKEEQLKNAFNHTPSPTSETEINESYELSDEDAFLTSLVFLDLLSANYIDVFPAVAKTANKQIKGIAYTNYLIKGEDLNNTYECGFVSIPNEYILNSHDINEGVEVFGFTEENGQFIIEEDEECRFEVSAHYNEPFEEDHYVKNGQYITYSINNYHIEINKPETYNYTLGYLYDYDLGRPIYDPELGKTFNDSVKSLNQILNADMVREYIEYLLNEQDLKGFSADTITMTYISDQAISDFMADTQREEFLGVSTEQLMYIEANLDSSFAYYIDENGEIGFIDLTQYDKKSGLGFWEWFGIALGAVAVVGLAILTCGAIVGAVAPLITMLTACLLQVGMGALIGAMTVAVYVTAVVLIAATVIVTANEVFAMFTGNNLLASWMGEDAYEIFRTVVMLVDTLFIQMGDSARQMGYTRPVSNNDKSIIEQVEDGDITLNTTQEKGNYGEIKGDDYMKNHYRGGGWERAPGNEGVTTLQDPMHKGIDGIYRRMLPNGKWEYTITEFKYGSSQLSTVTGNIRQMSDEWINSRILAAVGNNESLANEILRSGYQRLLINIGKDFIVRTNYLNEFGYAIRNIFN